MAPSAYPHKHRPGDAVAVVHDGAVVVCKAYGERDVEAGLPVTLDTQFLICSITKTFTATGLALLVDERRLAIWRPRLRQRNQRRRHLDGRRKHRDSRDRVDLIDVNGARSIPGFVAAKDKCSAAYAGQLGLPGQ